MKTEFEIGTILISKPFMEDKRFEKTVILIVESNQNGTVGFIINKETKTHINEIINHFPESNIKIKYGGPVETSSLFFVHKYPDLIAGSEEIKNGIFWGGDLKDVIKGLETGEITSDQISFFIGYAGWEKNQLKNEIKEGSWILHKMDLEKINDDLNWSNLLIQINKEYEVWATAPSNFHLN